MESAQVPAQESNVQCSTTTSRKKPRRGAQRLLRTSRGYRALSVKMSRECPDLMRMRGLHACNPITKKVSAMKLSPNFYVFTYEAGAKLDVAEEHHDHQFNKTAASARRPPESYTGTTCGVAPASWFECAHEAGSAAPRVFRGRWGRERILRIPISERRKGIAAGCLGAGTRPCGRTRGLFLLSSGLAARKRSVSAPRT